MLKDFRLSVDGLLGRWVDYFLEVFYFMYVCEEFV